MTPDQFTYWLQGFVEIAEGTQPTEAQWKIIKDHLQLVFKKETPVYQSPRIDIGLPGIKFPELSPGMVTC